jgi:hypothetical protein
MKLWNETTGTAQRSGMLAPAFGGVVAGVCPQQGRRRSVTTDGHAYPFAQDTTLSIVADGTVMGHRAWSPPIT